MAPSIDRIVRRDISMPACRAAMALGPENAAVFSWGKPAGPRASNAPDNTIARFHMVSLPLRRPECLRIDNRALLMIPCFTRLVKQGSEERRGDRPGILKGKHQFVAAQSALARRDVRV